MHFINSVVKTVREIIFYLIQISNKSKKQDYSDSKCFPSFSHVIFEKVLFRVSFEFAIMLLHIAVVHRIVIAFL